MTELLEEKIAAAFMETLTDEQQKRGGELELKKMILENCADHGAKPVDYEFQMAALQRDKAELNRELGFDEFVVNYLKATK